MAAILYTSGSTGRPKGVVLSHRNLLVGAESVSTYLGNRPDDVILAALPLSFDAGLSQLTTAFASGAHVVLVNYLLPRDVVRLCATHQVTGLTCVPPLWIQLAGETWPEEATRSLRYFANTGGRMPASTLARLREIFPDARPFLMYGLTEAFRSTYLDPAEVDRRPDSIGKAIPNAEVLVLRPDGSQCRPGEEGELVHRGPLVALGYWNDPERTSQRFRPFPSPAPSWRAPEIAVWSGDTVVADEEGFLYFVGRSDDMIKTSGYRVSPTEVEEAAYGTALVRDAVALGVEDAALGAADPAGRHGSRRRRARHRGPRPRAAQPAAARSWCRPRSTSWPRSLVLPTASSTASCSARRWWRERRRARGAVRPRGPAVSSAGWSWAGSPSRSGRRRSSPTTARSCPTGSRPCAPRSGPDVELGFAVKANPMPALVQHVAWEVDWLDVASAGEMQVALDAGKAPGGSASPAPARTDACCAGRSPPACSSSSSRRARPDASPRSARTSGSGRASADPRQPRLHRQGLRDADGRRPATVRCRRRAGPGARWTSCRRTTWRSRASTCSPARRTCRPTSSSKRSVRPSQLLLDLAAKCPDDVTYLNLGGGFGIPYFDRDQPLDLACGRREPAATSWRTMSDPAHPQARVVIELGRYLVGEAGVYVTRVVDRKTSRGKTYLVVDGGMHHQLAASGNFGQVIRRNYPITVGNRGTEAERSRSSVVGSLCTPLDLLGDDVELPRAEPGDLVVLFQAGAYGLDGEPDEVPGPPRAGRDPGLRQTS